MNIQLSISLLASDRAASLERCLDSLRPLLMQVPSELIIVFTGTDSRVKEIAERYTDKVIPFTWCDNFSAARNVGLWEAKGEWFLFIDDDEWFEDTTEIRDFFLSGEYKKYGAGLYKQKNYEDWDGIRCSDFYAFRMARIIPGIAFRNTVHEELAPTCGPWKYFDAYVNHYGYISNTGKLSSEKSSRNLPLLLQDIRERPSYIKNYLQIVTEYLIKSDYEKAEEYCRKGLALCGGQKDRFYKNWLLVSLVDVLYEKGDKEAAEKEALLILENEQPWELARLELYALLLAIYAGRNASDEILQYGTLFEETLAYMDKHPDLWQRQSYGNLTEQRIKMPSKLHNIRINCTKASLKKGDEIQAARFIVLLPWKDEGWMQQYYPVFDGWKKSYSREFQKLLMEFPKNSPYFLLQKALGPEGDSISKKERLDLLTQCIKETESLYLQRQALKEAILCDLDLAELVACFDLESWKQCTDSIQDVITPAYKEKLWDAAGTLCQSAPAYGAWLCKLLYEKALIRDFLTNEALIHTLDKYVHCILLFYKKQYCEEMFKAESHNLLPKDCRFALYVSEALKKMELAEYPEAIRLFRKALRFYPAMAGVIREVIRHLSGEITLTVQNTNEEFLALAQQMKEALKTMIDNRQYAEALPIILQLSPLLPKDLELLRIRQKVLRGLSE